MLSQLSKFILVLIPISQIDLLQIFFMSLSVIMSYFLTQFSYSIIIMITELHFMTTHLYLRNQII